MRIYNLLDSCPNCNQGLLEIWRRNEDGVLLVSCNECELSWLHPGHMREQTHKGFLDFDSEQRPATIEEIDAAGWGTIDLEWTDLVSRLDLTRETLCWCNNALNEVLHGVAVRDFDLRIGPLSGAKRLLQHVSDVARAMPEGSEAWVQWDHEQLQILINAMDATIEELQEEFSTRMGCTVPEARDLIARLVAARDKFPPDESNKPYFDNLM